MSVDEKHVQIIAQETTLGHGQVARTLDLLLGGATIPFVARYRKEVTGNLDEVQIGFIADRSEFLRELDERKTTVLREIESQGKLTAELKAQIEATLSKTELEDLYLPYKPKRRTRATIARDKGLEPLAMRILAQPETGQPHLEAQAFVTDAVPDVAAALLGAPLSVITGGIGCLIAVGLTAWKAPALRKFDEEDLKQANAALVAAGK